MAKKEPKDSSKETETASEKPKRSKLSLILLVLLLLVAGAAGFFGWNYFQVVKSSAADQAEDLHEAETSDESESPKPRATKKQSKPAKSKLDGATLTFEPFLVNLADEDVNRYLRTSMRIVVTNKEAAERISAGEVIMPKMRDTIVGILSSKFAADIATSEGKEKLKEEIIKKLNSFLPEQSAEDVFFTDFVVQF